MTDSGRQGLGDKLESNLKPDSHKSTTESLSDSAKGTYESAARSLQPEHEKSAGQKATDNVSSGSPNASNTGGSYLEQAQKIGTDAYNVVSANVAAGVEQVQKGLGLDKK